MISIACTSTTSMGLSTGSPLRCPNFPYLGLSPSASGRDDDGNPARWVYMDNGIKTLRVGACMVVTLMALPEGPVPLTHAFERGHET